jgi:hypothetical protein
LISNYCREARGPATSVETSSFSFSSAGEGGILPCHFTQLKKVRQDRQRNMTSDTLLPKSEIKHRFALWQWGQQTSLKSSSVMAVSGITDAWPPDP